jgi:hypothetical protein
MTSNRYTHKCKLMPRKLGMSLSKLLFPHRLLYFCTTFDASQRNNACACVDSKLPAAISLRNPSIDRKGPALLQYRPLTGEFGSPQA